MQRRRPSQPMEVRERPIGCARPYAPVGIHIYCECPWFAGQCRNHVARDFIEIIDGDQPDIATLAIRRADLDLLHVMLNWIGDAFYPGLPVAEQLANADLYNIVCMKCGRVLGSIHEGADVAHLQLSLAYVAGPT